MENTIINITTNSTDDNIELGNSDNDSNILTYYIDSIDNEQTFVKIIKSVEAQVRKSTQYRQYLSYLKSDFGLTNCAIFPNIEEDEEMQTNVKIEMHHFPFTLFDIVETVILNNIRNNAQFSTLTLASEVLGLHFNNLVGVVPLSKTAHQAVHAGVVFLDVSMVEGDVPTFVELFNGSFSSRCIESYNKSVKKKMDMSLFDR